MSVYYVLRQERKHSRSENWQPVSLYNEDNNFLGQVVFETEREAKSYMKKYNGRIIANNRDNLNMSNNYGSKINVQLKIFVENEKPDLQKTYV